MGPFQGRIRAPPRHRRCAPSQEFPFFLQMDHECPTLAGRLKEKSENTDLSATPDQPCSDPCHALPCKATTLRCSRPMVVRTNAPCGRCGRGVQARTAPPAETNCAADPPQSKRRLSQ